MNMEGWRNFCVGLLFCVYDEPSAGSCPKGLALRRSTKAGIWRMYIIDTIVEMVYKVYESSRRQPTRFHF